MENSEKKCADLVNSEAMDRIEDDAGWNRLSIAKCRAALGKASDKLTDDEVLALRDFGYELLDVVLDDLLNKEGAMLCDAA